MSARLCSAILALACFTASCGSEDVVSDEWIGRYGNGVFDAGHSVELMKDGSFSYYRGGWLEPRSCRGDAHAREGVIELRFVSGDADALDEEYASLVPIQWAGRHYLLGQDEVLDLCNDWNAYGAPRVCYLVRQGDPDEPFTTAPPVPAAFERMLLREPLIAHVTSATPLAKNKYWAKAWSVELDLGAESGAFPGMKLYAVEPKSQGELVVSDVGNGRARGAWRTFDGDAAAPDPTWTFSTRL